MIKFLIGLFFSILFLYVKASAYWFVGNKPLPDSLNGLNNEVPVEERVLGFMFCHQISLDSCFNYALYQTVYDWLGTGYRFGGQDSLGVDCSGFSSILYKQVFGIELKGGSYDIIKQVDITFKDKALLREGDLLFFKIRKRRISHVGVYLGNGKFAHSSTTNGVIISDLNDPYYKKFFYKAGRFNINY